MVLDKPWSTRLEHDSSFKSRCCYLSKNIYHRRRVQVGSERPIVCLLLGKRRLALSILAGRRRMARWREASVPHLCGGQRASLYPPWPYLCLCRGQRQASLHELLDGPASKGLDVAGFGLARPEFRNHGYAEYQAGAHFISWRTVRFRSRKQWKPLGTSLARLAERRCWYVDRS